MTEQSPSAASIKELEQHLYICDRPNQSNEYDNTTRAIAQYAGENISKNMKILVRRGVEKSFIKPSLYTQEPTKE